MTDRHHKTGWVTYSLLAFLAFFAFTPMQAQELEARITINHSQVQGTDATIFNNLQQTLEQFINGHRWTNLQFQKHERIVCSFNITVTAYDAAANLFTCKALIQSNRPVYNSAYTTTVFHNTDNDFVFEFAQFDQLNFIEEQVDNQLTALIAYYALLMIGLDLDSFSPFGGEEVLQRCMLVANSAQQLNFPGWKAFESSKNRYAFISDYLDVAMRPFRQLQYDYYRKGLDAMALNPSRARNGITESLTLLDKSHAQRPMSLLPQIWTDYKRDELANIYKGNGTAKERESIYNLLFGINPSQHTAWAKIKE